MLVLQQIKYITTSQVFNGPSDFTTLSSPSSPPTISIMHSCAFNRSSLFLSLYIFLCGSCRVWCALSLAPLRNPPHVEKPPGTQTQALLLCKCQLYHPVPDLSLAMQTKILVFSLSHSSKTVCTVTRQDLCWLRQCCASLTLGHSFLSLPLGTGKHAESQMFDQGPIWAKTEVVHLGTRERWSTQLRVVLWKQCWLHQCKARMELQCDAPIRSKF